MLDLDPFWEPVLDSRPGLRVSDVIVKLIY